MPHKKRLCIIMPTHWSYIMGGSEYQIKCLLESNLLQNEFDVFLLCRRTAANYRTDGYHLIPIAKPYSLQRYAHFIDAPFLMKKLKEISPDVIYQRVGTSYAGISTYFAKKYGCKMIFHLSSDANAMPYNYKTNGRGFSRSIVPYIEKKVIDYAINHSHKLIVQTNTQKQLIRQNYGRDVTAVIYNYHPLPKETIAKQLPVKVVWVANFKRLKQPELFLRLAQDISAMSYDTEFLMIGKPSSDTHWQHFLENRILQIPNLRYLGHKTNDEVNQIIAGAHILVNTSLWEGFSNTFIQAWMRAMPVVSLYSNPDGLLDGSQMGFASGSYLKLRENLSLLIKDHRFRDKIGKAAQSFAIRHFTMDNVKDIVNILCE